MEDKRTLKERLEEFVRYLNLTNQKFEKTAGLPNGFINKAGKYISKKSEQKMIKTYPELNMTWLLTGEGEMLKQSVDNRWNNNISITQRDNNTNNINQEREALITHLRDEVEYLREQNKQLMELLKK